MRTETECTMPIYEFRCDACGKDIEVFGQNAQNVLPPTLCTCGKESSFNRKFSTFAAHNAGGNFRSLGECCNGAPESMGHACGGACRCGHHG